MCGITGKLSEALTSFSHVQAPGPDADTRLIVNIADRALSVTVPPRNKFPQTDVSFMHSKPKNSHLIANNPFLYISQDTPAFLV